MAGYYEELAAQYTPENPVNGLVYQITYHIKHNHDYDSAVRIILDNNLKLEEIVSKTARLTRDQIVELASRLISLKK